MRLGEYEVIKIIDEYRTDNKIPFIIEVLGTPNSGKTTAIQAFEKTLRRSNVRYKIIYEAAGRCKIKDKLSPDFNLWTMNETIKQLLEVLDSDYDIVICERGLLDAICWYNLFFVERKLSRDEYDSIINYALLNRFTNNICLSYVMRCNVEESIRRENIGYLLDVNGSVVNEDMLMKYNFSLSYVQREYGGKFKRLEEIDTSCMTQMQINISFAQSILNTMKNHNVFQS